MEPEPVEELADLVHEIWADWMKYMFSKGQKRFDGTWVMPFDLRRRWQRQMNTPYEELTEEEKESDREIALRILHLLREIGG